MVKSLQCSSVSPQYTLLLIYIYLSCLLINILYNEKMSLQKILWLFVQIFIFYHSFSFQNFWPVSLRFYNICNFSTYFLCCLNAFILMSYFSTLCSERILQYYLQNHPFIYNHRVENIPSITVLILKVSNNLIAV